MKGDNLRSICSMSHRAHDRRQITCARQDPSTIIVSGGVQDQLFWKSRLTSCLPKQVANRPQVSRCGSLGRKHPTICPRSAPLVQNVKSATTHWHEPALWGRTLADRSFHVRRPSRLTIFDRPHVIFADPSIEDDMTSVWGWNGPAEVKIFAPFPQYCGLRVHIDLKKRCRPFR